MKILAIINPISGIGSKSNIPSLIADVFAHDPHELFITYSQRAGHARELAAQAVEKHYDCVIAVGGDGTVNEIAQSLRYTDVVLGIVPKGSGNGLARALKLPLTVGKALEVIRAGHVRTIDCCEADSRPFFCTCGLGFDAEVSKKFAQAGSRGPITYARTMIESYLQNEPKEYKLTIDGKSFVEKAFLVTCANAPQYGNNAYIAPLADLEDGKMNVVIIRPFNPLEAPQLALQLFTKRINSNSNLDTYKAENLIIERETEGVMHLDGDPVMFGKRIEIRTYGRSLKVFATETYTYASSI